MYKQGEKLKENKSRAVANSVAQKKSGDGKQGFGFVDNRAEAVAQRKLQEITQSDSALIAPTQRVAWNNLANGTQKLVNDVPAFPGLIFAGTTPVNVSGYQFNGCLFTMADTAHQNTKAESIVAIATVLGALNLPASGNFLKKKQLQTNLKINTGVANPATIVSGNNRNMYKGALDPFTIRVGGTFGAPASRVDIYYQFGVDSYGYITQIVQEGQVYEMNAERGQNSLGNAQKTKLQENATDDPLFNQFSSAHDTSTPNALIAIKANQSTRDGATTIDQTNRTTNDMQLLFGVDETDEYVTDNLPILKEKSDRLDAIAKLGGEGSRWQCVRNHAANLKDSSRFYTSHPTPMMDDICVFITFQSLWGQWANLFDSKFNIPNLKVIEILETHFTNVQIIGTEPIANMTADDYNLET